MDNTKNLGDQKELEHYYNLFQNNKDITLKLKGRSEDCSKKEDFIILVIINLCFERKCI